MFSEDGSSYPRLVLPNIVQSVSPNNTVFTHIFPHVVIVPSCYLQSPSPNFSQDLPIPASYSHSQHHSTHQTQNGNSIPIQSNDSLAVNTASGDNTEVGSTPGYQEEMRNEDSDITELLELLNMPT